MPFSKLWTKLFTKQSQADEIALHVAGATTRHRNPFENWEVPRNQNELDEAFVEKWVLPFYSSGISNADEPTIAQFATAARAIDLDVVHRLLGDFNWRSRITGAYFAAIKHYTELVDILGMHLLKSEVCFAGKGYALALATFGGERAAYYLTAYLDYYLDRTDLYYDQGEVFCALEHVDKAAADTRRAKWESFVADKPYWDLNRYRDSFTESLATVDRIINLRSPT